MRSGLVGGFIVVLLIAAGCSGDGSGEAATSSSSSTTTSTTTTPPATTTTTTAPATTTTTTTTSTTTTTVPSANGVIVSAEGVLGWVENGEWVTNDSGPVPASAGDEYSLVRIGEPVSAVTGGAPEPGCFGETPYIELGLRAETWPYLFQVGVSADWDLFPQVAEVLPNDNATYVEAAGVLMAGGGVDEPDPVLKQVIRADLEGDGIDEVFVVAENNLSGQLNPAEPGDYSIAFMRKLVEGEVQTAILGSYVVQPPADDFSIVALDVFRFVALVDLNGDGRLEIVTQGQYYEGSWTEVWDYVGNDVGPLSVLRVGCGA